MKAKVTLRALTPEDHQAVEELARSRTAEARLVERARIILAAAAGERPSAIARTLGVSRPTIYTWIRRFNAQGPAALPDQPRSGRPATYPPEQVAEVIAAALTAPQKLSLPFGSWTLDRLQAYLNEHKDIAIKRSRIDEILVAEGLRWRHQESWFGERVDPQFAEKRGALERLYTQPPEGAVVVCLDEMGPQAPKATPGQELVRAEPEIRPDGTPRPAERAKQAVETGKRGRGGYVFGAFRPATGAAFTHSYGQRNGVNWVDFLERVESWVPAEVSRVYGVVDNLPAHRVTDVLLFSLAYPRWEFVFQPKYAAYLNLIEPWWKVLKSLALKGRRFQTWEEVCCAVETATVYWNQHRHPFIWGRRRRHRPRRRPWIASVPGVKKLAG
jgi:transposase